MIENNSKTSSAKLSDGIPRSTWVVIAITTLVHILLALVVPLTADETYYWEWSRHLDFGYYDQGPLIAWAIRLTCSVFGDTVLGIRMVAILCFFGFQLVSFRFAESLFDTKVAKMSLIVMAVTPIGIAGGFMATYDALLMLCWSFASLQIANLLLFESKRAWIWIGIALGFGLLAKLTMGLFALCVFLFLLIHPGYRKWLRDWRLWGSLAIGFAILSPYIFWLASHDWITFSHLGLLARKTDGTHVLLRPVNFTLVQSLLVSPIIFVLGCLGFFRLWKGDNSFPATHGRLLLFLGAPVLVFFLLMASRGRIGENWPGVGWLILGISVAVFAHSSSDQPIISKRRRTWVGLGVGFSVALSSIAIVPISIPSFFPLLGNNAPPAFHINFRKVLGGQELGRTANKAIESMKVRTSGQIIVAATTYQECSRLAFFMKDQPRTVCFFLHTRSNQYVYWNRDASLNAGSNMLVVLQDPPDSDKGRLLNLRFDHVYLSNTRLGVAKMASNPDGFDLYYFYECYGYRPDQSVTHPDRVSDLF